MGGDDDLGLLYRSNEGCSAIDGRLFATDACQGTIVGDELHIAFDFEVMWQMKSTGINIGALQVRTYDEDGFTFYDENSAWTFERDLTVAIESMEDISGDVASMTAGPLSMNAALQTNDVIKSLEASNTRQVGGLHRHCSLALEWTVPSIKLGRRPNRDC